jgi:hypothetical protein
VAALVKQVDVIAVFYEIFFKFLVAFVVIFHSMQNDDGTSRNVERTFVQI